MPSVVCSEGEVLKRVFFRGGLKVGAVSLGFSWAIFGAAEAATVNIDIVTQATNPHQTVEGIRDDTVTRGSDLGGALIRAEYTDGTSVDMVWQAGPYTGEAVGTDIYLFMNWFGFEMNITNRLLGTLSFDLAPANTIFDMSPLGENQVGNTPTTGVGSPFGIYAGGETLEGSISVIYSGIVNLAGRVADGDAYTSMLIDFTGLLGGGFGGALTFKTDMDTMRVEGDLTPVPLPESLPLLFASLGGMGLFWRRRKAT